MHPVNRLTATPLGGWSFCAVLVFAIGTLAIADSAFSDTEGSRCVLGPAVKNVRIGPGVDFAGRDLKGTEIVGYDLTGAVFDDASLAGARLFDCVLNDASLKRATLQDARISDCKIKGADFTDSIINNILPTGGGYFPRLDFTRAQLVSTRSYKQQDLSGCAITRKMLGDNPDFRGFNLTKTLFGHGDFRDASFECPFCKHA